MPTDPKRQHTVPRFLLRNFADDRGKLHCFDRRRDGTYVTTPENALVESHIYTLKSQGFPASFVAEHSLSELESRAAHVIDRIVASARSRRPPGLPSADKDTLDAFVLVQFRRSAERYRALHARDRDEIVEEATVEIERALPNKDVRGIMRQIGLDRIFRNSWISSLAYEAPGWLPTKGLAVVLSPPGAEKLLIGSDPVLLAGEDRRRSDGEVILPVASDVAISLALTRGQERLFVDDARMRLARMINSHVFNQSDIVAAESARVFERLAAAHRKRQRKRLRQRG